MTSRIANRSKKRAAQEREYADLRAKFLHTHFRCQVCCQDNSSQIHHKKGRIGELLTNTEFFLAVCAYCHFQIEKYPSWAKEQGYSLSRLSK